MAKIEGFRIRNFRTLRDVTLGRLWTAVKGINGLTPMTAVVGKNGAGKSTLFDAFGFMSDCLKSGVEEACDRRNGFERVVSQGIDEPIMFEIYYREDSKARPITYEVSFALDEHRRPYVKSERLRQRRKGQDKGRPFSFLILENGRGVVWKGEYEGIKEKSDQNLDELMREESKEKETVELDDNRKLGVATLGALKQHPRISLFRKFIEGWYLSYFTPDAARSLLMTGPQKHLSIHGDNIGNVVQFMERDHPERFKEILKDIAGKIPGVDKIDTVPMQDGRLLLRFNDKGFKDAFSAQQMSDGTLKIFTYLLLLSDPTPPPFICIEEPENGLYHKLLETLAAQFRAHVTNEKNKSQIFITTHQPYFVNALEPNEVWVLEKGEDGFSKIHRASDNSLIQGLVGEGLPLGGLWYSDYLEGA
ncbi:MAG: AAA family ATPase [Acidobacteriota bacterium]|jgi:predicted ATPase|nr:AAA family ATPase [Acidobacteriota bacterium]